MYMNIGNRKAGAAVRMCLASERLGACKEYLFGCCRRDLVCVCVCVCVRE